MIALEVERLTGFGRVEGEAEVVSGVAIDSRLCGEGDLFVVSGQNAPYVDEARERGATVFHPTYFRHALLTLAALVRERSAARVVAVTGSLGKTTVKEMITAAARAHLGGSKVVAAPASYNNEVGVPLTMFKVEEQTELVVLELAQRGFGHIRELCAATLPDVGVITGVAPVHLDQVGSVDGVLKAKQELIWGVKRGREEGVLVVPSDFPLPEQATGLDVHRFAEPTVYEDREGLFITCAGERVSLGDLPAYQSRNAACALTTLEVLGLPRPESLAVALPPGRGQRYPLRGGGEVVDESWNANPNAMKAALSELSRRGGKRLVAVLGDMRELGAHAVDYHREVAEHLDGLDVDVLVAVGDLAEAYLEADVPRKLEAEDAAAAATLLLGLYKPGDRVLVKGSRALGLDRVVVALRDQRGM